MPDDPTEPEDQAGPDDQADIGDPAEPDDPPADPTRRAAIVATLVAVPVVVVLLVLVRLVGPSGSDDEGPVADVPAQTSSPREETPVEVATPPVTPQADATCPVLMAQLPLEVAGETSRRVDSDSPYVYAWGDPAQVLVCGAEDALAPDSYLVTISGLTWSVDTTDPTVIVWTTVDRVVPIRISVPSSTDAALVTALGPVITGTVPPA